jgi:hypothetical protein
MRFAASWVVNSCKSGIIERELASWVILSIASNKWQMLVGTSYEESEITNTADFLPTIASASRLTWRSSDSGILIETADTNKLPLLF